MKQRDRSRRFFARPSGAPARGATMRSRGRGPGAHARQIPRWFWLAAGLWLAWVGVFSDHSFWRIAQLKREIATAEREAAKLRADTDELSQQVSDPEAKRFRAEEIARTQHGWAAPGELVYRFRGSEPVADTIK